MSNIALVFPLHDPKNIETPKLKQILPILKDNFSKAYISVTPSTQSFNKEAISFIESDDFFVVNKSPVDSQIGEHFLNSYKLALQHVAALDVVHLAVLDRLIFEISNYKSDFLEDVCKIDLECTPIQYVRTKKAWETHPKYYMETEQIPTKIMEILFNIPIDFVWCQMSVKAADLKEILPNLINKDLLALSEIAFYFRNTLKIKEVDWLSWEDPFIFNKDAKLYREIAEHNVDDFKRRVVYVRNISNFIFDKFIET